MDVRLTEVRPHDVALRKALAAHHLPQEQHRFSATAAETLALSDADPGRSAVAILADEEPVGMFCLDRGGRLREVDDSPHAVLLRAFYIAPEHQGRGHARTAVGALRGFVCETLPGVRHVVLTVNHRNPGAIATYLSGGFVDTGADYLGGSQGPQHVFALEV